MTPLSKSASTTNDNYQRNEAFFRTSPFPPDLQHRHETINQTPKTKTEHQAMFTGAILGKLLQNGYTNWECRDQDSQQIIQRKGAPTICAILDSIEGSIEIASSAKTEKKEQNAALVTIKAHLHGLERGFVFNDHGEPIFFGNRSLSNLAGQALGYLEKLNLDPRNKEFNKFIHLIQNELSETTIVHAEGKKVKNNILKVISEKLSSTIWDIKNFAKNTITMHSLTKKHA